MPKKSKTIFNVFYTVKLDVNNSVAADTFEEALEIARMERALDLIKAKSVQFDGWSLEVVGVFK